MIVQEFIFDLQYENNYFIQIGEKRIFLAVFNTLNVTYITVINHLK